MRQKHYVATKLVLIGIFAVAWIIGGVFGVSSLASAAPQTIIIDFHDNAYYIGEVSYEKLNDAIATAADGDTVVLDLPEDHVVQNQSITITQDITLSGILTTAVLEDEEGIVIEGNVTFSDLTFRSGHLIPTISAVTVRPGGKLSVSGGLFSIAAGIAISADGAVILTDGASIQLEGNGTIGIVTDESASITVSESSIVNKDGQYQMPVVVHSGKAMLESGLIEMDDTDFVRVREGAALEVMPGFMFASATLRRNGRAVNEEGKFYNGILPGVKGDLDFDGNFVLRDRFEAYPSQKTDFYNHYGFLDPIVESVELIEGTPLVYDYLKPSDLNVTLSGYAATLHLDYTVNWEGSDRFGLSGAYEYTLTFLPTADSPDGVIADTILSYTSEITLEIGKAELRFDDVLPTLSDSVKRMYLVPIDGSDLEGAVVYAKRGPGEEDWGTQPIAGSLRFVEDTYLRTGTQLYEIQFIPQAEECYLSTTGTIEIADVAKKNDYAVASDFRPSQLTYGQTVGMSDVAISSWIASLVDAGASGWIAEAADSMPTVADSGARYGYHVIPSDPDNYDELDFELPVSIDYKTIDLIWVLPATTTWNYRSADIVSRYGFVAEGGEFEFGYRFADLTQFVGDDLASIDPSDYSHIIELTDGKSSAANRYVLSYPATEIGNYRYRMQNSDNFTITITKGDLVKSGAIGYDALRTLYYFDLVTEGTLNAAELSVLPQENDFDSASADVGFDLRFADETVRLSVGSNEIEWIIVPHDRNYNTISGTVTVANVLRRPIESVKFSYLQEFEYGIRYDQLGVKAAWNLDAVYMAKLDAPVVTLVSTGYPEVATTAVDVRVSMKDVDQQNFVFNGPTEYSLRIKVTPAPLTIKLQTGKIELCYGDLKTSFENYAKANGLLNLDEGGLKKQLKADDTVEELLAELGVVGQFDAILQGAPNGVSVGAYTYGVRVNQPANYRTKSLTANASLTMQKAKKPLVISLDLDEIRYLPGESFLYTIRYDGFQYSDTPENVFSKLPVIEKASISESGYYDLQATSETPKNYNVEYTEHQVIVMRTEFYGDSWYIKGVEVDPKTELTLEPVEKTEGTGIYRENELAFAKFKKTTTLANNYKATMVYRLLLSQESKYNRFENMEIGVMAPTDEGALLFSYYYQPEEDKYQTVNQAANGMVILDIDKLDHDGYFVLYSEKELIDYWYFFVIGIACLLMIIIAAAIAAKQYRRLLAEEEAARIAAERNAIVEEIEEIIGYLDPVLYDTHVRYDEDATVAAVLKELKPYPPEHERFVRKTVKKYNRERRKMMERQIKEAAIRFRAQHTPDKNIKLK